MHINVIIPDCVCQNISLDLFIDSFYLTETLKAANLMHKRNLNPDVTNVCIWATRQLTPAHALFQAFYSYAWNYTV